MHSTRLLAVVGMVAGWLAFGATGHDAVQAQAKMAPVFEVESVLAEAAARQLGDRCNGPVGGR